MQDGYKIRDQSLPHFITATVVDWIDVFSRKNYRDCIIECLDFCIKNKGMIVYGYVIMSNHIHLIIQSNEGKLSDLIRDFKKFTAKSILEKIQTEPRWLGYESKLGQRFDSAEMFSVPANMRRKETTAFLFTFEKKDVYKIQSNNNRRMLFYNNYNCWMDRYIYSFKPKATNHRCFKTLSTRKRFRDLRVLFNEFTFTFNV